MKIIPQGQNPLEWLVLQTGLIPQPLLLAHFGFMMSKIIWEAIECNVLETLALKRATAAEVAVTCTLDAKATTALLGALAGMQLVKFSGGKYALTKASKKWLLKKSPESYRAMMQFDNQVCYDWMQQTSSFLRTGKGLQYHQQMNPQQWVLYQNGMTDIARNISRLAAQKIKLPAVQATLLDIGGAQGIYAKALLKKKSNLTAVVFDLPEAIATRINQSSSANSRLIFQPGNISEDDIGNERFDVILMASVAHHFTEEKNKLVARKVFAALKPGASFYVLEFFRKEASALSSDMIGALQNFFFSFSSTSGLWNEREIKSWLQETGFKQLRTIRFLQLPGFGMVVGRKTGSPEVGKSERPKGGREDREEVRKSERPEER